MIPKKKEKKLVLNFAREFVELARFQVGIIDKQGIKN